MDKFLLTKPGFMPIELGGILIDSYMSQMLYAGQSARPSVPIFSDF